MGILKMSPGAGEVAQQFGAPSALLTRVQFPAPTWPLTAACNSNSRGSSAPHWPSQALHTCGVQTYVQANSHR